MIANNNCTEDVDLPFIINGESILDYKNRCNAHQLEKLEKIVAKVLYENFSSDFKNNE